MVWSTAWSRKQTALPLTLVTLNYMQFLHTTFPSIHVSGTVIIDELHMVGDEQRGHILELILLKLML